MAHVMPASPEPLPLTRSGSPGDRWAPLLATVLLLAAVEWGWALRLGVGLHGTRLLALGSILAVLVVASRSLCCAAYTLARRLAGARAAWLLAAAALPLGWLASTSLFSGAWVSSLPGVGLLKLAFGSSVALAVVPATRLALRVAALQPASYRAPLGLLTAALLLCASVADNLIEVGHYPAFHLLVGAGVLFAGSLLGRVLVVAPSAQLERRAGITLAVLLLLVIPAGSGRGADALVTFTHGLMPKARLLTVALADGFAGEVEQRALPAFGSVPPPNLLVRSAVLDQPPWELQGGLSYAVGEVLCDAAGQLSQRLAARPLRGRSFDASVDLFAVSGADLSAQLVLEDLRTGERAESETVQVGAASTGADPLTLRASIDCLDLSKQAETPPGERALVHAIEPSSIRPETGLAWIAGMPESLAAFAENVRAPDGPSLLLLEDGVPLGAVQRNHSVIRSGGGGAWCLWGRSLYLSTADGSDPRSNGRRYTLVAASRGAGRGIGELRWSLLLSGEGHVRLLDASLVEPMPSSGAEIAARLADEFRLVPTSGAQADALRSSVRNVIVILLDAVRQDYVGPRPDGPSLTPRLDDLAAEGVSFATTYSPSDHTGRSVPCLMTSFPLEVTLRAADWSVPLTTWLEHLTDAGYHTFNNGSDYILRRYGHLPISPRFGARWQGTPDSKLEDVLSDEVLEFARSRAGKPFAVYTHWSYAHVGRSDAMAEEYAEMVALCDQYLGQLVDGLEDAGLADETLLVITADHGYGLGEFDQYLGAHGTAEFVVRVPMVMVGGGLPRGVVIDHAVSNLSIATTVLDLLQPESGALMGSPSLMPTLLDRDGVGALPEAVFSSTGFSSMTRSGNLKLTEDQSYRTAGLFDLASDPHEREPVNLGEDERRLRALRVAEDERQARLSQALVASHRAVLSPDVISIFAAAHPDADDVEPLLRRFHEYDARTREFLLAEIYRRKLVGLGDVLDGLAGGDDARIDDLLLVIRLWAGRERAVAELPSRLPTLDDDARLWLAALLPELDSSVAVPLMPVLEDALTRAWAADPQPDSAAERWVALLCFGLPFHLPPAKQGHVKDVSIDVFNAWSMGDDEGPYFATLRDRRFMRRMLIDVFSRTPVPDDLERASRLVHNRHIADRMPRMCRELGSPEARAWLLSLLRTWEARREPLAGKFIAGMLTELQAFEDDEFRAAANAIIQERFPYHPAFD